MSELSKLQIRAKVLSVISKIKSINEFSEDILTKLYDELNFIDDKAALFYIFFKEYIKMSEKELLFTGCLIKELIDKDFAEEKIFDILKSSNYSDDTKYKLVQLLRIYGSDLDYNSIPSYFDNPKEILDTDTKKLLENAAVNPEAMLDFLDFVSAVPSNDRKVLLQSLKLDYSGDILANIIYPILYSDFDDSFKLEVIGVLSDLKSSLALKPFSYLAEISDNPEIVNACNLGLKKLKLAGVNQNDYIKYFKNVVKDSFPAEFFTTIPDGNGNQAFLISRVNKSKKYSLSAVVTNDITGIVDCFGFYNISQNEIVKVISRFYQSEGRYKVNPSYVKSCIQDAVNLTISNKLTFPYEFICWDSLLIDIQPMNKTIIEILNSSLQTVSVDKDEFTTLLTKEFTFRWYIKPSENSVISMILDEIYNCSNINIEFVNELIKNNISNVFDDITRKTWIKRIEHCAYLLDTNMKKKEALIFYTLLYNVELFKIFEMVLIQRSIFNHFISLRELSKESILTTNIFRKKQAEKNKYDIKKIECVIKLLKKNWINE